MADKARKLTDQELKKLEKEIYELYATSAADLSEKWRSYMSSHKKKLNALHDELEKAKASGNRNDIKAARDEYERAVKNVTLNDNRYKAMINETTSRMARVNEIALNYANDEVPKIYTLNYNAFADEKIDGYTFTLVNERAVKNLFESDKIELPPKKLDVQKDKAWNAKNINSQLMQGILQGESIPKIAARLQNVTDMNRNSAIRNARTMVTGAENKGRQDSFKKATDDGVLLEREWIATHDGRTRAWHKELHGMTVGVDEPFVNDYGEIMYPGDPDADPCNVYNCRCSIRAHVLGFAWNKEKGEVTDIPEEVQADIQEYIDENNTDKKSEEMDKNGLTFKEQAELASYKSFDYYAINETLRKEGFDGLSDLQKEKVKTLDSALDKLPTYSGDVSRSLYFSDKDQLNKFVSEVQNERILYSEAYASSTRDLSEYYNPDGQVQILIKNTKNGRDLTGYDNGESEVLFGRDSLFAITEQRWENGVYKIVAREEDVANIDKVRRVIPSDAKELSKKWNIPVTGLKGDAIKNMDDALHFMQDEFGVDPKDYITMIDTKNPYHARNYKAYYISYDKGIHLHKQYAGGNYESLSSDDSAHEIMHALNGHLSVLETESHTPYRDDKIADEIIAKVYSENDFKINKRTGLPFKEDIAKTITKYGSTNSKEALSESIELVYQRNVLGLNVKRDKEMHQKVFDEVKRRLKNDLKR